MKNDTTITHQQNNAWASRVTPTIGLVILTIIIPAINVFHRTDFVAVIKPSILLVLGHTAIRVIHRFIRADMVSETGKVRTGPASIFSRPATRIAG